jgi:hypothetical protein
MCITFGTEINHINAFFNYFTDFKYAVSIRSIDTASTNGFIKEIKYRKDRYDAYAILKSSLHSYSDNLMYEYEVGQYINKKNKLFSCFLETYGLFQYENEDDWIRSSRSTVVKGLTPILIDYSIGCPYSKYIAILLQHVNHSITIKEFIMYNIIQSKTNAQKIIATRDMIYLLYQVYMPLSMLANEFTHYDFHYENVLLYQSSPQTYITYHYHLKDKTITFNSKGVAKIIDYGRCYYHDTDGDTMHTYKKVCTTSECKPTCGKKMGLSTLRAKPGNSFYYIHSSVKNSSHDLRLGKMINTMTNFDFFPEVYRMLTSIVYTTMYGTKEMNHSGLPHAIHNVHDMKTYLEQLIESPDFVSTNKYSTFTKLGDFHMYQDGRPMEFIKI